MNRLISVMTSRFTAEALRPNSSSRAVIASFLGYLAAWESHANGAGGFLSESTAVGLRATLSSTLELRSYLTQEVGYKYITTLRLSQDPTENFYGIVRQASSCNDHPTPTQFLMTMNCMSFYSLVKTVRYGNADPCALSALLETGEDSNNCPPSSSSSWHQADDLMKSGNLPDAGVALSPSFDHEQHIERSDSRLVYNVYGYIAKKCVMKTKCEPFKQTLTMPAVEGSCGIARLTLHKDKGGLLYPRSALYHFERRLEDMFTECFSRKKLHTESILDLVTLVRARWICSIGCSEHAAAPTKKVISFYLTLGSTFLLRV